MSSIRGLNVPQLECADEQLGVLEMTIVNPSFILDFATAYLGKLPAHLKELMDSDEWRAEKQEEFGDDYPEVQRLLSALRGIGIHFADVHPRNIVFRNVDRRQSQLLAHNPDAE